MPKRSKIKNLFTSHQVLSHPRGSRAQHAQRLFGKTNAIILSAPLPPAFPRHSSSPFTAQHEVLGHGLSPGPAGVLCPGSAPRQPAHGDRVGKGAARCCAGTAKQQLNRVISSVLGTNLGHSIKKTHPVPARPSPRAKCSS